MNPTPQEDQGQTNESSSSNEFITLHERVLSEVKLREIISASLSPEQNCNAILAYVNTFHWEADEHDEDDEMPELESITPASRNLSPTDSSSPGPEPAAVSADPGPIEDVLPKFFDKRRLQLNKHSKLICKPCGRNFGTKSSYSQHCRAHHSGPRTHRCEVCGKRFDSELKMKAHQRRHSIRDKPFKCGRCPKQFLYRHDLSRHESKHHGHTTNATTAVDFACKVCGLKFFRHDLLAMHEIRHGRKDEV